MEDEIINRTSTSYQNMNKLIKLGKINFALFLPSILLILDFPYHTTTPWRTSCQIHGC